MVGDLSISGDLGVGSRSVYQVQNRIGVQLQAGPAPEENSSLGSCGLWASLYSKPMAATGLLEQARLADKRNARS